MQRLPVSLDTMGPETLFSQLDRVMNALTGTEVESLGSGRQLAIDLHREGDSIVVTTDVPGLKKEDITVDVSADNVLTISATRKHEEKEEEGGRVVRLERSYGTFARSVQLPDSIEADKISAKLEHGELTLTIPSSPAREPKGHVITIQGGDEGGESGAGGADTSVKVESK